MIRALGPPPPPTAARRRLELSATEVLALQARCVAAGARRPTAHEALVASLCRAVSGALRLPPRARCALSMVLGLGLGLGIGLGIELGLGLGLEH